MSGKITLTKEMIKDISGSLQAGMTCYLHKKSGEMIETMEGAEYDPEWDDGVFGKQLMDIEDSPDDYIEFSPMSSSQAFDVMEDFANQLETMTLKIELINALDRKRPFRNFKDIIDSSDSRQDWFDFQDAAYENYIKEEFEWQIKEGNDFK